ncbi:TatD family hydrolase [Marinomonas transparens]|uniref:TatD family hydrolase n=1 Tax=Marinomonas transparens TaxID=2795388 RepID=A0A934MWM6_9GAMM|nr:TatD family hydrolase [Marinomonas transparens]MBJ7538329.1 TatD family hydrolase [Marinomonas transparens]
MFIDSHCHFDFELFDDQRDSLMSRCLAAGVAGFLVPATTRNRWQKLQNLTSEYSHWRAAYGLHPYFLSGSYLSDIELLGDQCEKAHAIGVGEIGLDNWPGAVDMELQMAFFTRQLYVAKALELPVILHARKSYDLVLKCLRETGFFHGGTVHAFNGSLEQAQRFLDFGFVLGIGGTITYPRAKKAHRVLKALGDADFVLETDSPDMPLHAYQGQVNTPLSILIIAQHIATIREDNIEKIRALTYANLLRIFPKWYEDSL